MDHLGVPGVNGKSKISSGANGMRTGYWSKAFRYYNASDRDVQVSLMSTRKQMEHLTYVAKRHLFWHICRGKSKKY